jgi:hypothetical protein
MTQSDIIREVSTWLQSEKIKQYGQDKLSARRDRRLRVDVYNQITGYYSRRMSKVDFGRFRKSAGRILFDEKENLQQ